MSTKILKQLRKLLWKFLTQEDYTPTSAENLFKLCHILKKDYTLSHSILTEWISQGKIRVKKGMILPSLPPKEEIVTGQLHTHPKGFGFVTPDNTVAYPKDIFIPKQHLKGSIDLDYVEVKLVEGLKKDKGPEGIVLSIIKRQRDSLVGVIYEKTSEQCIAYCPILGDDKYVSISLPKKHTLKIGDRVLLQITSTNEENLHANLIKTLGHIDDASQDVPIAALEYGISQDFSKEALEEAKKYPIKPQKQDLQHRLDLTKVETFTIDPDTAKDYDDALSLTQDDNGDYHLIVHIADVSHYVPHDSALDHEAYKRGNSTYFPGQCIPMLPEALSNGLCSLKENVVRLTISAFIHLDPHGNQLDYDIKKAYIKSQKRFTYKEAKTVLDGKTASPHSATLHLMVKLCKLLQKLRRERGSVDLSMPETALQLDDKGHVVGFETIEYDITHQLVEEFMLKANEVVAHALLSRQTPAIFRVHADPAPSDLEGFATIARSFGFKCKKDLSKTDLQQLFEEAKTSPYLRQLSVAFIRSMKLAIYSEENVGHFGLALQHYCHFTSPIRRYSDLVIHRLLFDKVLPVEDLKAIALHCSTQERLSFRAESSVISLKKLRYLHTLFIKDPTMIYDAIISKVKPFGIYFEVAPLAFEGFVHISEIGQDYYIYQENLSRLIGESSNEAFSHGKPLHVILAHINLMTQQTLWTIVNKPIKFHTRAAKKPSKRKSPAKRKSRKNRDK